MKDGGIAPPVCAASVETGENRAPVRGRERTSECSTVWSMASRNIHALAIAAGVGTQYSDINEIRRGYGLNASLRPTVSLSGRTAEHMGLIPRPINAAHPSAVTISTVDVQAVIREIVRKLAWRRPECTLMSVAWNIELDACDPQLKKSPVLGKFRTEARYDNLVTAIEAGSLPPLPPTWTANVRDFRQQTSMLTLEVAKNLPYADARPTMEPLRLSGIDGKAPVQQTAPRLLEAAAREASAILVEPVDDQPEALESLADDLSIAYAWAKPSVILSQAIEPHQVAMRVLQNTHDQSRRQHLNLVLSKLCGVMSYAALDLDDAATARSLVHAVHRWGQLSGNDDARAWALGTEAMIHRFERDYRRSLHACEQALGLGLSRGARARVYAQLMLGYSELQNDEKVLELIRDAEECVADGAEDRSFAGGIFGFPISKFHYYAGAGLLGLGPAYAAPRSSIRVSRYHCSKSKGQRRCPTPMNS